MLSAARVAISHDKIACCVCHTWGKYSCHQSTSCASYPVYPCVKGSVIGPELCEGSANDSVACSARVLEERYVRAALLQGDYWRSIAHAARRQGSEIRVAASPGSLFGQNPTLLRLTAK